MKVVVLYGLSPLLEWRVRDLSQPDPIVGSVAWSEQENWFGMLYRYALSNRMVAYYFDADGNQYYPQARLHNKRVTPAPNQRSHWSFGEHTFIDRDGNVVKVTRSYQGPDWEVVQAMRSQQAQFPLGTDSTEELQRKIDNQIFYDYMNSATEGELRARTTARTAARG